MIRPEHIEYSDAELLDMYVTLCIEKELEEGDYQTMIDLRDLILDRMQEDL